MNPTLPTAGPDWTACARRLVDELTDRGVLHDPRWRDAMLAVPRHELVPRHFNQHDDSTWHEISRTTDHDEWLAAVYSNSPLVTAITDEHQPQAASSSSQPSLMIRMLEALDIDNGHRVLEIGTGTGYNAALLCHRLDDAAVHSLDIDPALVAQARERLAQLGYRPALTAADGVDGWSDHAPYDRIIATCSVRSIPWEWAEQTTVGGRILVDLKTGVNAGNLVLLHRHPDRLEGRFLPKWAGFMAMRHDQPAPPPRRSPRCDTNAITRTTTVGPQPWDNLVVWFLAQFHQPPDLTFGLTIDEAGHQPVATFLAATDGSWSEVDHHADDGHHELREGGPTPLWRYVENAYQLWHDACRPGWERFGVTVTADHQHVWLDAADDTEHTWPLERDYR